MKCPICKTGKPVFVQNADIVLDIKKNKVFTPKKIATGAINFFDECAVECDGCHASSKENDELYEIQKGLA